MDAVSPFLSFDGVVLAGGRSSRMGRNKALLPFRGAPLWRHSFDLLGRLGIRARTVSVARKEAWLPEEVVQQVDLFPAAGPLGGIVTALRGTEGTHLIVLAVDLPYVPEVWWRQLRDLCRNGVGAVGFREDGFYEPLAAIYPRTVLADFEAALATGRGSLQPLLRTAVSEGRMVARAIAPEERRWFVNWNKPADVTEG